MLRLLTVWNLVVFAAWIALPFALARTLAWSAGWLHLVVVVSGAATESALTARFNPVLRRRRQHPGEGTRVWDLAWNAAYWPIMAAIAVTAGAQFGAHGSTLPAVSWIGGVAVAGAGFALSSWAMCTNPHFEGTVRIQREVGHRVFERGPYAHVRHPGYLGLTLWALGSPLLLRASWSIPVAALAIAWVVLRTTLEDALLQRELEGYADYARRTRHRLLPGIW